MSKYSDIIESLEMATGPNYALDVRIWLEFVEKPEGKRDRDMVGREPPYTASIDRAIALLERSFLSGLYRIEKVSGSTVVDATRVFWATAGAPGSQEDAYAPTAPLAILLALFKALHAQEAE